MFSAINNLSGYARLDGGTSSSHQVFTGYNEFQSPTAFKGGITPVLTAFDVTAPPSSANYSTMIRTVDKNYQDMNHIFGGINPDSSTFLSARLRTSTGSNVTSKIVLEGSDNTFNGSNTFNKKVSVVSNSPSMELTSSTNPQINYIYNDFDTTASIYSNPMSLYNGSGTYLASIQFTNTTAQQWMRFVLRNVTNTPTMGVFYNKSNSISYGEAPSRASPYLSEYTDNEIITKKNLLSLGCNSDLSLFTNYVYDGSNNISLQAFNFLKTRNHQRVRVFATEGGSSGTPQYAWIEGVVEVNTSTNISLVIHGIGITYFPSKIQPLSAIGLATPNSDYVSLTYLNVQSGEGAGDGLYLTTTNKSTIWIWYSNT